MLVLDRVLCDCCGDDMGQLLGGECTTPGSLVDMTKPPYFAVCPECNVDVSEYLQLPSPTEAA